MGYRQIMQGSPYGVLTDMLLGIAGAIIGAGFWAFSASTGPVA